MKRFEVEVERTDTYIIELDETKLDQDWIEHFKRYFYDFNTLEEHADHIAQFRARFGERFIEGYGDVLVNGRKPIGVNESDVNKAINIKVISEDNEIRTWTKELK